MDWDRKTNGDIRLSLATGYQLGHIAGIAIGLRLEARDADTQVPVAWQTALKADEARKLGEALILKAAQLEAVSAVKN